tara:strand:+ start:255 stop:1142 length:888 start_codon:yes stop_codon:yes gene_type:complete
MFYGSSQTYYPTGADSTTYSVNCIDTYDASNINYYVNQTTFRGDTTINGRAYIKVYDNYNRIDTAFDIHSSQQRHNYILAFRDSAKKLFTIKANDSVERLVYDFGLSVGDTMIHYTSYLSWSYDTSILFSIDSFLINYPTPHYRKRFTYATPFVNFPEVEGLALGFLGISTIYLRTTACGVICIQQKKDYILRPCDTCDCYSLLLNHKKTFLEENNLGKVKVYPNPFSETITVDFKDLQIDGFIKIIDIAGREILNRKVNHNKSVEINLAEVPSGVYIVSLETNGETRFAKIVKE